MNAYEAWTMIDGKFIKKYIVVSASIPKSNEDLGIANPREKFVSASTMPYEVIVKWDKPQKS